MECTDFDDYKKLGLQSLPHFRDNLAGERTGVRMALHSRRHTPLSILSPGDAEREFIRRDRSKRQREEDSDADAGPSSQYPRLYSPLSVSSSSPPPTPSPAQFRLPSTHSLSTVNPLPSTSATPAPLPSPLQEIQLPTAAAKKWPETLFAVDIVHSFQQVDAPALKKDHPQLRERIHAILGYRVPESTFQEQHCHWNRASEQEQAAILKAGHSSAGLWINLPKRGRGRV